MKRYLLLPSIFILLCNFAIAVDPQNIRFSHITVDDGLTHNNVNSIIQDHKGFIWLGTRSGLCSYDGYNIKHYLYSHSDSTTINHNFVTGLMCDREERIWVTTEGGVCRYDSRFDRFTRYDNISQGASQISRTAVQISDGRIVVGVSNGLYVYDERNDLFARMELAGDMPRSVPHLSNAMIEDRNGVVWVGTTRGLYAFDVKSNRYVLPLGDAPVAQLLKRLYVTSLELDTDGRLFIGTHYNGVYIYDSAKNEITNITTAEGLSSDAVRSMKNDGEGNMWIGGEWGINILNLQTGKIETVRHDRHDRSNLNDNAIYAIHKDNNGNIWVGTYFGGANIYLRDYNNFTYYSYGASNHHLNGKAVREIIGNDDKSIWVATEDGGLHLLDLTKNEFQCYDESSDKIRLSYHNVHSLLKDKDNNLWIGTFTGGLNRYNLSTGQMSYYKRYNSGVPLNIIFSIVEDTRNDVVWIGGAGGLSMWSNATGTFTEIINPMLRGKHVYTMMLDSDGVLWVGMRNDGVITYDHRSGQACRVDLKSDFQSFITDIYEDRSRNIWIGTNDGGVTMFDRDTRKKHSFTTEDGLPSNSIMSIISDNSHRMWISTIKGLCCLDTKLNRTTVYTVDNGLPTNQFNYTSSFKNVDGKLFFGTVNGLISFYPDKVTKSSKNLKVAITDLKIVNNPVRAGADNQVMLKESLISTNTITLTNSQAMLFSLDFTAFNFGHNNVIYAMQIDGLPWQTIGTQHQITFSNLSMGSHTISLKASTDGITWDESGICSIDVDVLPPFYLSWWAFMIYVVLICAIALGVMRIIRVRLMYLNSIKIERMEKAHMQELNRHKIGFFTNISHELKTPLTLILSPLKLLSRSDRMPKEFRSTLEVVTKNAQRMHTMIDELMTFSKIEMKREKIKVCCGVILPFIDEMCQIFRIVAVEKKLNLVVDINKEDRTTVWFSPTIVEKIIYNLLSNALKFTPANGIVEVHASVRNKGNKQFLHLEINDTGIGIPPEAIEKIFENYYQVNALHTNSGSGIGLAFTKSLANMHHGTISVSSVLGQKSSFVVELDVTQSTFSPDEQSDLPLDMDSIQDYEYNIPSVDSSQEPLREDEEDETPKILIVEDNKDLNDFISDIFRSKYTVFSAEDGRRGYELICQVIPDIVISDVMMPEIDGFELTSMIKSELLTCHIPVVLLTAKTSSEDEQEGYGYGADVYIKKPFDAHNLELQINNMLQTKRNNIKRFRNGVNVDVAKITSNPRDEKFMNEVIDFIRANIDNEYFSVNDITDQMGISRSMLYVKLKNIVGVSSTELIRNIRFKEAKKKLIEGFNVSEASYAVGISDPNYFTKCFKKQFGVTPTEFIKNIQNPSNDDKNINDLIE